VLAVRNSWKRVVTALAALAAAGLVGCGDAGKTAEPKYQGAGTEELKQLRVAGMGGGKPTAPGQNMGLKTLKPQGK
jgi:hypothetical protein